MLSVLRGEVEQEAAARRAEAAAKEALAGRLGEEQERAAKVERAAGAKQRELEVLLDYAQKDADALRGIVAHLEAERDEARAAASAAAASGAASGGLASSAGAWGRSRLSVQRSLSRAASTSSSGGGVGVLPDGLGSTGTRLGRTSSNASGGGGPASPAG
jgi:hypothetical protein